MTSGWALASLSLLAVLLFKATNLIRYIRQANRTGLPYVVIPVPKTEVLGIIATPIIRQLYNRRLRQGEGWP